MIAVLVGDSMSRDHRTAKPLMRLPILDKLKDGEKFDFATLADNTEQTDEFLDWWWAEKAKLDVISWPEIISDDDPILTETHSKSVANLSSYREFFDRPLFPLTQSGVIPNKEKITRESFRRSTMRVVAGSSIMLQDRPQVIFTAGGYGSGKSTIVNELCKCGRLPVPMSCLVGADIFKQLIPEYHLIKAVGDGRANSVVQKECVNLSSEMYVNLIETRRSFVWDSSMASKEVALDRIMLAKKSGYETTMIAVLTPLNVAIRWAMNRAKKSGRFPPLGDEFASSHVGFKKNFNDFVEHFDEITVFANLSDDPDIIAVKESGEIRLEVYDQDVFNSLLGQ